MKHNNFDLDGMLQELQNRNRSMAKDFPPAEEFKAKLYEQIKASEQERSRRHLRFYRVLAAAAVVVLAAAGVLIFGRFSNKPTEPKLIGDISTANTTFAVTAAPAGSSQWVAHQDKSPPMLNRVHVSAAKMASRSDALLPTQLNTEEYKTFEENPFIAAAVQSLSTFGADIDTASYTNARRMLQKNQLPQRDAVRIEEFVNFFTYQYPQPEPGEKFSVTFESMAAPWQKNHRLLLIGVQAQNIPAEKLPPANYVFLIDNSGSMHDDLELVSEAMKTLLSEVRKQDRISIVTYGGEVRTLLSGASAGDKAAAIKIVNDLRAHGYTPGGKGIQTAYQLAHKHFIKGGNNRIILITDGDFNVGVSSESELVQMVEKERSNAIYLSVLGVGANNYKENKLKMIANKGNGNCYYIDNLREARQALKAAFANRMFAIAKDVKFQLEFNPNTVQSYRLLGYEMRKLNARDFNDDTKDSGEIGVGCQVTALYEIVPAGVESQAAGSVDKLKYQKHVPGNSKEILTCKVRYQQVEGKAPSTLKTFVLPQWPKTNKNVQWAACPAEFALLLRNSPHKGSGSYQAILKRARKLLDDDPNGDRAEFLTLVRNAAELTPKP